MTLSFCVEFLGCTLLLAFCHFGNSLRCYKCVAGSESECNNNQTLSACNDANQHCATAEYSRPKNDHTYIKTCLPRQFIKLYCKVVNDTKPAENCSISSCDKDYCNGPQPTTPITIATIVDNKSPTEGMNNQQSTASPEDPGARSGSPSTTFGSSTLGITITSLAFWNILEIS